MGNFNILYSVHGFKGGLEVRPLNVLQIDEKKMAVLVLAGLCCCPLFVEGSDVTNHDKLSSEARSERFFWHPAVRKWISKPATQLLYYFINYNI